MLDALAEKLSKKFDGYALIETVERKYQVRFAVNKIAISKFWDERNLHILVEKDKKVYVTSLSLPLRKSEDELIAEALKAIERAPPRDDYQPLPEPTKPEPHPDYDKRIEEEPEKLVELASEAIEHGTSAEAKRIAGVVYAEVVEGSLLTSAGADLKAKDSRIYVDVRAFMDKETTGHSSMAGRFIDDIDVKRVSERAAEFARMTEETIKGEPGKYRVALTPDAFATLLNEVGGSASAFSVEAGFSFFVGKLNQQVASEKLTVLDIPRFRRGFIYRAFDDEGVKAENKEIIGSGILKTYVHNRFTAKKFNAKLTGNAGWIAPQVWQIEVLPGDAKEDEILEVLGDGILVGNVTYLRFQNYIEGTFSAVIRDGVFLVKGGEVKARVKGLRLSDSIPAMLKGVEELSRERVHLFHWWLEEGIPVTAPWVVIKEAGFTKAFGH